jgi:hypothetical protein
MASFTRSTRTSHTPEGAVWPVVKSRWMTASTVLSRSFVSAGGGTL